MSLLIALKEWLAEIDPPGGLERVPVEPLSAPPAGDLPEFQVSVRLRAPDHEEAFRRFRRLMTLLPPEEIAERALVEEILGTIYPDEYLTAEELADRLAQPTRTKNGTRNPSCHSRGDR